MINEHIVWKELWPLIQYLVQSTANGDERSVSRLLDPTGQAADILDLFGLPAFEILLKIVLGREQMGLARAIESDQGRFAHIEIAWPDPLTGEESYGSADILSLRLKRYQKTWLLEEINPGTADMPMTEPRAQNILLSTGAMDQDEDALLEPWILPVALFAGVLQLPVTEDAMQDSVERLFLPGMQQRSFGITSLVAARRLWRDFCEQASPKKDRPSAWAASVEFVMSQQSLRDISQAAVGQQYGVEIQLMLPPLREMKQALDIEGLDDRYSPFGTSRVLVRDEDK